MATSDTLDLVELAVATVRQCVNQHNSAKFPTETHTALGFKQTDTAVITAGKIVRYIAATSEAIGVAKGEASGAEVLDQALRAIDVLKPQYERQYEAIQMGGLVVEERWAYSGHSERIIDRCGELELELDHKRAELVSEQGKTWDLEMEIKSLKQQQQQPVSLLGGGASAHDAARVADLERQLSNEVKSCKAYLENQEEFKTQIADLNQQLAQGRCTTAVNQGKVAALNTERDALRAQHNMLQQEMLKLQTEKDAQAKVAHSDHTLMLAELQAKNTELQQAAQTDKSEIAKWHRMNNELQGRVQEIQARSTEKVEAAQERVVQLEAMRQRYVKDLKSLQIKLDKSTADVVELTQQLTRSQDGDESSEPGFDPEAFVNTQPPTRGNSPCPGHPQGSSPSVEAGEPEQEEEEQSTVAGTPGLFKMVGSVIGSAGSAIGSIMSSSPAKTTTTTPTQQPAAAAAARALDFAPAAAVAASSGWQEEVETLNADLSADFDQKRLGQTSHVGQQLLATYGTRLQDIVAAHPDIDMQEALDMLLSDLAPAKQSTVGCMLLNTEHSGRKGGKKSGALQDRQGHGCFEWDASISPSPTRAMLQGYLNHGA